MHVSFLNIANFSDCFHKISEGTPWYQTYANNSYLYIDSIKFMVSAMHRGQHNYDKPKKILWFSILVIEIGKINDRTFIYDLYRWFQTVDEASDIVFRGYHIAGDLDIRE